MSDEKNQKNFEDMSFEEQTYEFARRWKQQFSRRDFMKMAGLFGGSAVFASVMNSRSAAAAPIPTPGKARYQEPKQGGVIRIARLSESDSLDPHKSSLLAAHEIMTQIFDPLIQLDGEGTVYPFLAESWEFTNDNKTLTFTLKDGITFHDGSPFNAQTVAWTVERHLNPETASPTSWMLGPVERVEVIDDLTVAYHYTDAFVPLWVGLSYSYGAPLSQSAVEAAGDEFGRNPVGTGPFKFVSWEPDQGITLEANQDRTWGSAFHSHEGPPYLDGAQYIIYPEDATRIAALQSGDVDMTAGSDAVPIDQLGRLENTAGLKVVTAPAAGVNYTYINTSLPPLDDVRVRQAINYAVDKEKLIQLVLGGNAEVSRTPVGSAFASVYTDEVTHYDYDLEKAQELMAEAGQADGFDLTYYLLDGDIFRRIGEVVKEDLAQININVELQSLPVAEMVAKGGEADAGMYYFWYTYSDADIVYQLLKSGEAFAWSYAENEELNQLIAEQRLEFDLDERAALYARIQQIAVDEAYWLFLYETKYATAMQENVQGVWFDLVGFNHLQDIWLD